MVTDRGGRVCRTGRRPAAASATAAARQMAQIVGASAAVVEGGAVGVSVVLLELGTDAAAVDERRQRVEVRQQHDGVHQLRHRPVALAAPRQLLPNTQSITESIMQSFMQPIISSDMNRRQ